jgi:hypothetical protein
MEVYGSTDSRDYHSLLNTIAYSSGVFFTCLQKYGFERFVRNITNKAGKKNIFLQFKVDIDNNWDLSLDMFSKQ